jgi:glycosyltransferase involved in cell wall biosynthesis
VRLALIGPVYPYRGGIAHYTTRLAQALIEREHSLLLVSFKRLYPHWLFPGQSDRDPSGKPLKAEQAHYWLDSLNPFTWLATFRRIRAYRPEAIILQWWTIFWAPAWFVLGVLNRLFLHCPLIIPCHNVLPHEVRWWDPLLAKMVLRWGTSFVVQSEEEERRLHNLVPQARTTIFPLPVLDLWREQVMPKEQARQQLGVPLDTPLLLFFGIVREYKGLQDLLAAMPAIRARLGDVTLLVAGEFWEDSAPYLETIRQLGIQDEVRLDNRYIPDEEAVVYFSAADVLVAPYRTVTGSAVVQMARGFGLPVVTTRLGGLVEVAEGELGLLAPPADPDGLAAAIVRYFEDDLEPSLREHIRQRRDRYSWEQLVALLETLAWEAQP